MIAHSHLVYMSSELRISIHINRKAILSFKIFRFGSISFSELTWLASYIRQKLKFHLQSSAGILWLNHDQVHCKAPSTFITIFQKWMCFLSNNLLCKLLKEIMEISKSMVRTTVGNLLKHVTFNRYHSAKQFKTPRDNTEYISR